MYLICPHFQCKSFKSVQNVQIRQVKCGLREQIWCPMFKVDRCSMYPGSLPLISNGNVPGHEKLFNVRRCSMYTGVQFDRFHCILHTTCYMCFNCNMFPCSYIAMRWCSILYGTSSPSQEYTPGRTLVMKVLTASCTSYQTGRGSGSCPPPPAAAHLAV